MMRLWQILKEIHGHLDIYFSYLVATSVTLQASWDEFDAFIEPKYRHAIIGTATAIVVFDRMRKAIQTTKVNP